jgi:hypothetical protein
MRHCFIVMNSFSRSLDRYIDLCIVGARLRLLSRPVDIWVRGSPVSQPAMSPSTILLPLPRSSDTSKVSLGNNAADDSVEAPCQTPSNHVSSLGRTLAPQTSPLFDPEKHIAFKDPPSIFTMQDIGFADDLGVSPVAATQPFLLFSPEAIQIMRSEIAKPEVRMGYQFSSNIANPQLRGYARKHAPFTYAAWNHPATVAIVSRLAGIDLVPWSDYEIAHINLSAKSTQGSDQARQVITHSDIELSLPEKNKPIVDWHIDSYPFVCVLMLSDCTNMVGGETALRTASGNVVRLRGPTEGFAIIIQGRYVTHQALSASGTEERITAVTSWRPRSAFVKDDSVLSSVRDISNLDKLYPEFVEYRLKIIAECIKHAYGDIRDCRRADQKFDTLGVKTFLQELVDFLSHTDRELVTEDEVLTGWSKPPNIPNIVISSPPKDA